jgi:hypothetical protein
MLRSRSWSLSARSLATPNFREPWFLGEVRRIPLPRTPVNTSLWMLLEPASALEDEVESYGD